MGYNIKYKKKRIQVYKYNYYNFFSLNSVILRKVLYSSKGLTNKASGGVFFYVNILR